MLRRLLCKMAGVFFGDNSYKHSPYLCRCVTFYRMRQKSFMNGGRTNEKYYNETI